MTRHNTKTLDSVGANCYSLCMLVHRIAHPLVKVPDTDRACGPYNATAYADWNSPIYNEISNAVSAVCRNAPSHTPTPDVDGLPWGIFREGYQSCFVSVEQARDWFRAGVEEMNRAGFRWFTYDISERYVLQGYRQAAAKLRRGRLVSLTEIPFQGEQGYRKCSDCYHPVDECDCTYCPECAELDRYCSCIY